MLAQYALRAIAEGAPISSFAAVAGWFHDANSVAPFYGNAEGVARRITRAEEALERFVARREDTLVPAYEAGNERAGMFFELDYYANPSRGAVPQWKNQMAELSWLYWLTNDGLRSAAKVSIPTLFVHSDDCVLPNNLRAVHDRVRGEKRLLWREGTQIDYYDRPDLVEMAGNAAADWFTRTMVRSKQ